MITLKGNNGIYEGLSTDTKPSDVPVNTEFHELDTDKTGIRKVRSGSHRQIH